MGVTYVLSLEGEFAADEDIVVVGRNLDVFTGNVDQFLAAVFGGLTDVEDVELLMDRNIVMEVVVVTVGRNPDACVIKFLATVLCGLTDADFVGLRMERNIVPKENVVAIRSHPDVCVIEFTDPSPIIEVYF